MTDPSPLIGPIPAPELHVMTYNIRRRMPRLTARAVDQWERRKPLVRRLLQEESPSILAVQEALPDQAQWVHESLGASFEGMGFGRDADRGGERVMLFVDRSRFAVRDWSQIALSATPDVAGSRSWGNRIPRTAVIAELTDHATNRELTVVATHFDHLSRRSRLRSAELVAERVVERRLDQRSDAGHRILQLRFDLVSELLLLTPMQRMAADHVDRAMLGSGHEPRAGIVGNAFPGPLLQGADERILRAVAHIRAHLDAPLTLDDVAEVACLSPSRFRHLFVEQTGMALRPYILWRRFLRVWELLTAGASLSAAAHSAGFADAAHLSRTSRAMFGFPPSLVHMLGPLRPEGAAGG